MEDAEKALIKKFVEEDYKNHSIRVVTDNEHIYYHRAYGMPDIVWDWDNNRFMVMDINLDSTDQNGNPIEISSVSLDEIQFMTAFVNTNEAMNFITTYYKDAKSKEKAMTFLQKVKPGQMGPRTLRTFGRNQDGTDKNM